MSIVRVKAYSHVVALCEGKLDGIFIGELAEKLGFKTKLLKESIEGYRELQMEIRRISSYIQGRRVIVFPAGGIQNLNKWFYRVINHVIDINKQTRRNLIKVLVLIDQNLDHSPREKATKIAETTIEKLARHLSKYKLKLQDSYLLKSTNHVDKYIARERIAYAETIIRIVVVDNSLECAFLRLLKRRIILDKSKCHEELSEEIKKIKDYSLLVSNILNILEKHAPPWYSYLKGFMLK